jgi:hypothetical protein
VSEIINFLHITKYYIKSNPNWSNDRGKNYSCLIIISKATKTAQMSARYLVHLYLKVLFQTLFTQANVGRVMRAMCAVMFTGIGGKWPLLLSELPSISLIKILTKLVVLNT